MSESVKKAIPSAVVASAGAAAGMVSAFQCPGADCASCFKCLGMGVAVAVAALCGRAYGKRKEGSVNSE